MGVVGSAGYDGFEAADGAFEAEFCATFAEGAGDGAEVALAPAGFRGERAAGPREFPDQAVFLGERGEQRNGGSARIGREHFVGEGQRFPRAAGDGGTGVLIRAYVFGDEGFRDGRLRA